MALSLPPSERDPAKIAAVVHQLLQGRINSTGLVTLTANAATTVVSAPTCGAGSKVFLFPKTANAAAEIGAGTMYILDANIIAGQFTVTHANNAQVDRSYCWLVVGGG